MRSLPPRPVLFFLWGGRRSSPSPIPGAKAVGASGRVPGRWHVGGGGNSGAARGRSRPPRFGARVALPLGRSPGPWARAVRLARLGISPGASGGRKSAAKRVGAGRLAKLRQRRKQRFETQIYANIPQRRLLPAPRKRFGLRFGRGPRRQRRVRAIRQQSRRRAFRGRFYGAREPLTARRPALCPGRPRRRGRPLPCSARSLGRAAKRRPPLGLGRQPG